MTDRITTESSVWLVDDVSMIVTRLPRTESPEHDFVSYDEVGAPFEVSQISIVERAGMSQGEWVNGDALRIVRASDGEPITTGIIIQHEEV